MLDHPGRALRWVVGSWESSVSRRDGVPIDGDVALVLRYGRSDEAGDLPLRDALCWEHVVGVPGIAEVAHGTGTEGSRLSGGIPTRGGGGTGVT